MRNSSLRFSCSSASSSTEINSTPLSYIGGSSLQPPSSNRFYAPTNVYVYIIKTLASNNRQRNKVHRAEQEELFLVTRWQTTFMNILYVARTVLQLLLLFLLLACKRVRKRFLSWIANKCVALIIWEWDQVLAIKSFITLICSRATIKYPFCPTPNKRIVFWKWERGRMRCCSAFESLDQCWAR